MNAKLFIYEAFDASLETVFETIFTSSDTIIECTAGQILVSKNQCIHFAVNSEIIFHRTLREGHFGLVGALKHTIVAKRYHALVLVDNDAAHFGRRVFGLACYSIGDFEEISIPIFLTATHITPIIS